MVLEESETRLYSLAFKAISSVRYAPFVSRSVGGVGHSGPSVYS